MTAKNPAAVALGRRGGVASAKRLTKAQRHQRAKNARQAQLARKQAIREPTPSLLNVNQAAPPTSAADPDETHRKRRG